MIKVEEKIGNLGEMTMRGDMLTLMAESLVIVAKICDAIWDIPDEEMARRTHDNYVKTCIDTMFGMTGGEEKEEN